MDPRHAAVWSARDHIINFVDLAEPSELSASKEEKTDDGDDWSFEPTSDDGDDLDFTTVDSRRR
jgi:hypothetical protein